MVFSVPLTKNGDTPIATPLSAVEVVEIDGQDLNWRRVEDDGTLSRVSVALKSGDQDFKNTLRARNVDGEWLPPKPVYWLLPRPDKGAKPNVRWLAQAYCFPIHDHSTAKGDK
jgi:hypothetical protein